MIDKKTKKPNTRRNNRRKRPQKPKDMTEFGEIEERVLQIRRVSKKTTGGSKIGFTALAVVGDRSGTIGCGYGKASSVPNAIAKAVGKAKKSMVRVNIKGGTIAHEVSAKRGSAKVLLLPAPEGTGIIAGGSIRPVVELAGIKNISSKMIGANNKISNVRCTIDALQKLRK